MKPYLYQIYAKTHLEFGLHIDSIQATPLETVGKSDLQLSIEWTDWPTGIPCINLLKFTINVQWNV